MISENEFLENLKKKMSKFLEELEKEDIPDLAEQLKRANRVFKEGAKQDLTLDEREFLLYLYKNYIFDLF